MASEPDPRLTEWAKEHAAHSEFEVRQITCGLLREIVSRSLAEGRVNILETVLRAGARWDCAACNEVAVTVDEDGCHATCGHDAALIDPQAEVTRLSRRVAELEAEMREYIEQHEASGICDSNCRLCWACRFRALLTPAAPKAEGGEDHGS